MACSVQCAQDYVSDARIHLIEQLKNLPLIIEKLYQKKVLNNTEVSDLEAIPEKCRKTRKVLDWITNKGKDACLEFLKILDLERKSVLPLKLHTWISHFSFGEESDDRQGPTSCHEVQTLLKTKAKQILDQQWKRSNHFFGGNAKQKFTYIPLVLDIDKEKNKPHNKVIHKSKKSKKPRGKKLRSYIPKDTCRNSPEDLLNSQEKSILLVGKPGIGKTTAVKQMLYLWAERHDENLDFMFYFDKNMLTNIATSNLQNLLLDTLIMSNADLRLKAEEITQYLEDYSEKVTIIFDGISGFHDNSVLLRIIHHELLPEAKIVVTCRPETEDDDFFDWPTCKVYVQGFNEESIYTYLTQMPDQDPELVNSVVDNPALFSLCHVPMYAFMVAACFSYYTSEGAHKQCTATELYIRIFRHCIQRHVNKKLGQLDAHIKDCKDKILLLAESAFSATKLKTINLEFDYSDSCIAGVFLRSVSVVSPAFARTFCSFLHNTIQEFFSALWLLEKPQKLHEVLQLCQTEEYKHMKYVIPFLCGLLSETNIPLLKCLFPPDQLKGTFDGFSEKVLKSFLHDEPDEEYSVDAVFLCQCLNEFHSSEACFWFLERVDYSLDLSEEHLDPHQCCAVSYVISQSRDKPIHLNLENSVVSFSGLKTILRHSQNLRDLSMTLCQVWTAALKCEQQSYLINLLLLCGNEIYLPITTQKALLQQAEEIITQSADPIILHLCCGKNPQQLSDAFCRTISTWLPSISSVHFTTKQNQRESCEEWEKRVTLFKLNLCLQAALHQKENVQTTIKKVTSCGTDEECNFLLDLYSCVKQYEIETGRNVLPALLPLYQSTPAEWIIDLSERKASLLLEVLKLQTEKKTVELSGWSDEESEVRSFLQCLPFISQLRFAGTKYIEFVVSLFHEAAESERQTGQKTLELLTSMCINSSFPHGDTDSYRQSAFLLDLYSHVKQYETETGRNVLPALLPVYQSAPAEWIIDLSERRTSLLLEVLKLQRVKKPVELRGWSDEESEIRRFFQCLPFISQLRFADTKDIEFVVNLFHKAAESERQIRLKTLELLMSVCSLPYGHGNSYIQSDFLLDLYSHVKQYETETGRNVLPALRPVYQSVPAEWIIDLSVRKASLLLEVLKLQTVKKPVELRGWLHEESEVRSFLQCLPFISQLRFNPRFVGEQHIKFMVNLFRQAAESERQTGEKTLELLTSACTYSSFPYGSTDSYRQSAFLLDLYSHVKQYETETGRNVLPALLLVYQSVPAEWIIDLSERRTSLLLEVLKLQTEKKPVKLRGWSDEESEVRSFLQCLSFISQLRFSVFSNNKKVTTFLMNLIHQAAENERQTGEKTLEMLSSVCTYSSFPHGDTNSYRQSAFLLDLYSHVKQYEIKKGRTVLPALLPVYQAVPAEWIIDLSERKASLLLEVLKLQTEKKPLELRGWSDKESEVRSFLQCLPFISQLRFSLHHNHEDVTRFLVNLFHEAAERETLTGEKTLEQLTSLCTYSSFTFGDTYSYRQSAFLLDLYSHVKEYETKKGRTVLPALLPVYQSAPVMWFLDLSEWKTSLLLEVLKLQMEKKPVELRGCSGKESEVRSFLQCLPFISQLRFSLHHNHEDVTRFLVNLFHEAAERETLTGEKTLEQLTSLCTYSSFTFGDTYSYRQSAFLLDLYSHVKEYETKKGRTVLPALLPVYQSAPVMWFLDLSEWKTSLLLEVLKLQMEKKPVELRGCSGKESEVRSFLQCLPFISQLRFSLYNNNEDIAAFLVNLFHEAAESERLTGEKTLELLTSLCTYSSFPYGYTNNYRQSDFLLDLYSHMKLCETGRNVLPALLPVYQSVPGEWIVNLSERKASLLLEVLKLQTVKKPVELWGWADEESEVRSFLQCLPFISHLRFSLHDNNTKVTKFVVILFYQAAESERQTGEKTLELLTSLCTHSSFPYTYTHSSIKSDFLLDLYSHVKQYETETGRNVLPALLPVYQSVPAEWIIDLSEGKASILLEVLKLQTVKKPVELRGWSHEESEVRTFLQCLPFISQLRFSLHDNNEDVTRFLVNMFHQAAETERQTGEKTLELLTSLCTYSSFPCGDTDSYRQSAFLLDLYSHVKQYETETGRNVLPALRPVYQSVPAEWIIDLSVRKASLLLEVLKLQTVKKPVELRGWLHEESEVRSFLQCLPFISQLRFNPRFVGEQHIKFMVNLFRQAAESERQTGEKTLELLTSACTYSSFPYGSTDSYRQSAFLLDLYSHVKQYETETGRNVLPALLLVYQSVPAEWIIDLSERRTSLLLEVLKLQTEKKPVKLRGWSDEESEVRSFLQCLSFISQLRFSVFSNNKKVTTFLMNLIHQAAENERQTGEKTLEMLSSVCTYSSFPHGDTNSYRQSAFLLDLYSHVKQYEIKKGRTVLPALLPVYQAVPAEWIIDLSERKASLLLEVLKLQTEKKPLELRGWSDKESEVRSFLQCLPFISQLRFSLHHNHEDVTRFLVNLFHEAAERETLTGEKTLEQLTSLCTYSSFTFGDTYSYRQSAFLLDLYSHVKEYETKKGRTVLPALLPVYQSAPVMWFLDLSEWKTSLLLEVLKLQMEKKPVELRGCLGKESEVRSFLQCLPFISQLRFSLYNNNEDIAAFLVNLFHEAAESERLTGEKTLELLTSLCTYSSFPYGYTNNYRQSDFLLDLYSHMKLCETGRNVLPALLPVYQSVPAEWIVNLSERKASLLLEVLKLQTVKKPVELWGWADEESEVRSFLQCLPFISQLRFSLHDNNTKVTKFVVILFYQAAESERQTGEKTLELLTSLCTHSSFPYTYTHSSIKSDFLLDLYSHVKQYETETGRNVLPALLPVYQSVPAEWIIDLSEGKASILLEVLKLQTVKKPVELRGWSHEESEVRTFLQCLPFISQLRFSLHDNNEDVTRFLVNMFHQAAETERQTGEKTLELLTSLCTYSSFPCGDTDSYRQSAFLLDLYSHVKQYETETGRNVLPALLPVYQSAPTEWIIDLSERRTSLLLEVLKHQTEKKPVELRGWSHEESEVRTFLQCLPFISQLRFSLHGNNKEVATFLVNLIHQVAESERQTGAKTLELLTSACTYSSFPRHTHCYMQSDFLLDLYSHVKQYKTETGRNVLPALLPVYKSAPVMWFLNLSERKASFLLEVLKLQTEKKPVELRGWSDEESEVRTFLQCLPFISHLRYAESLVPYLNELVVKYTRETELLTALLSAMDSTFTVNGVLSSKKCRAVGRALGLSPSRLNLTLKPRAISLRGAALLFRHITHLHKLCLNDHVVGRMARAFRAERVRVPLVIEELSVVLTRVWSDQKLSWILSSLSSLLNIWTVRCLILTECEMEALSLIGLMCHPGPLTIRLSKETLQQFAVLVYEVKDRMLTCFFLEKVEGDLTFCSLSWEELIYFVQHGVYVTVNVMKSSISYTHARELLPLLDKVHFKRLRSSVVLSIIREVCETGSAHCVSSLLSSIKNCINLNSRELDSFHCAALRFTLQHCTTVSLSLLWTSIPEGELKSILPLLSRVSHLSVDRFLLLKLLHCCSVSQLQERAAAAAVLSALQNRLDFSCRACLDLTTQTEDTTLHLTTEDCRVISTVILKAQKHTELILEDCEIEDAGVDVLFSALHTVRLRCSKALLLQFLALIQVGPEQMFRAVALSRALDGEVDLSEAHLDLQACKSLAFFLEYTDDLSELDLSHCRLTNHCLELLLPYLHKVIVLDLSHNDISDSLARRIFSIVSSSCNIQIVRLFNIRITDKEPFLKDKRFEIW